MHTIHIIKHQLTLIALVIRLIAKYADDGRLVGLTGEDDGGCGQAGEDKCVGCQADGFGVGRFGVVVLEERLAGWHIVQGWLSCCSSCLCCVVDLK